MGKLPNEGKAFTYRKRETDDGAEKRVGKKQKKWRKGEPQKSLERVKSRL